MEEKVAIILSVYNGEKYLKEQIDSLLNQSYRNIDIFIHDDGSKDESRSIILQYSKEYDNIHYNAEKGGHGYPRCFLSLLESVSGYEYYAFCDQDDVWLPDKIKEGLNCLSKQNPNIPLLYYTAVEYCDSKLNHIRDSRFAEGKKKIERMSLQSMLFGGEAMGMTFMFNDVARVALIEANIANEWSFKDWFLKLYCASCGRVLYNPKPSAKYRRHNEAVTNSSNPAGKLNRYIGQIKDIFFSKNGFDNQKNIIDYMQKAKKDSILRENVMLIELFSKPNSLKKRMKKVCWKKRFRSKVLDEIGYRMAFLIGKV